MDTFLIGRKPCGCITTGYWLNNASDEGIADTVREAWYSGLSLEITTEPVQMQGNCQHAVGVAGGATAEETEQ